MWQDVLTQQQVSSHLFPSTRPFIKGHFLRLCLDLHLFFIYNVRFWSIVNIRLQTLFEGFNARLFFIIQTHPDTIYTGQSFSVHLIITLLQSSFHSSYKNQLFPFKLAAHAQGIRSKRRMYPVLVLIILSGWKTPCLLITLLWHHDRVSFIATAK